MVFPKWNVPFPPPFSLLLKQAKNLSCPIPFFQILSSPISLYLPQFTSYLDNNNNHLTALAVMHVPHNSQLGFSNKSQTDRVTLNWIPFSDSYNLYNDSNSWKHSRKGPLPSGQILPFQLYLPFPCVHQFSFKLTVFKVFNKAYS